MSLSCKSIVRHRCALPCIGTVRHRCIISCIGAICHAVRRLVPAKHTGSFPVHPIACPGWNLCHLHGKPLLVLLLIFEGRPLFIGNRYLYGYSATLVIYFLQNPGKLLRLPLPQHRILHGQLQLIPRKGHIRPLKEVILHRGIFPQFRQNTVPIDIHQLLGIILGREMKMLIKLDYHWHIGKKLFLNLFLHPEYVFFLNQAV